MLVELLQAIDLLNPDTVEPVIGRLRDLVSAHDLDPITKAITAFDFELAKTEVTKLCERLNIKLETHDV